MPSSEEIVISRLVNFVQEARPLLAKQASESNEISRRAPKLIDRLVKLSMVDPRRRDEAIKQAEDPIALLSSLEELVGIIEEKENGASAIRAGSPAVKSATQSEVTKIPNFYDSNKIEINSQADVEFVRAMGFNVPDWEVIKQATR